MAECIAVIPARISSSRIPQKPLSDLCGKPLIQRVYENALNLRNVDEVVVAVDSERVADVVKKFKGRFMLTPPELASGSDRVYYAVEKFFPDAGIIVNLQGDEPFISTELIDRLVHAVKETEEGLCSAYFPICEREASDSSVVKVVVDRNNLALYFSRSPIPWGAKNYKKHIGVYVWRRDALEKFSKNSCGALEETEKLEQLRVLEYGGRIMMLESPSDSLGIDTPEDLEKARRIINEN